MQAFDSDKESLKSERQSFEDAHAAALAALAGIPDLMESEGILLELASVFFPDGPAQAGGEKNTIEDADSSNLEARYRTLVEQIPAIVFMAFLDRGIGEAYVSPQIEAVLGFKQEEWLNDPVRWYQQIHPLDKARWSLEAAQMFLSGQPLRSVYRVLARDGRVVWFHCDAKMVRRDDGRPWFIHGVAFDISEIKRAEEALREAHDELEARVRERTRELAKTNEELRLEVAERQRAEQERIEILAREQEARKQAEDANRLKDEFLATLSHELRTPMTAIIGWTHLLRGGMLDEENTERALETIDRNARSQTQLIEDLLDISRVITGKLRLETRQVELIHVIEAAVDSVRPAAEAKKIELRTALAPEANWVQADPGRLQQIVWNLLSNGIKFTPHGGRVEVRLERAGTEARLTVSDTGEGIAPEFLPHVFDRFRQADGSMTRAHGGLGLGLSIVRHLTELHGGTVTAESPGEGQGSTFILKLPLLKSRTANGGRRSTDSGAEAGQAEIRNPQSAILEGLRVLIVEDERDARELFAIALKHYGAEVTAVESAVKALDVLRRSRMDVMVSDLQMPGMDGYELIGTVRTMKADGASRIPAIAMTAHARTEDRMRSLLAGYQAHLSKPVEPTELVALIAALAGRTGHGQ